MKIIEEILKERPKFHCTETEISRYFDPDESFLLRNDAEICSIQDEGAVCYGIGEDVAKFIEETVGPSSQTMETGAGVSTLIFAIKGATHTSITPSELEVKAIKQYAHKKSINMDKVRFIRAPSEQYLPNTNIQNLDLVFLDGKHAFPWPIIDWFYTADKLKKGGIMMIDDAYIKSVTVLVDFMMADPGWTLLENLNGGVNMVFRKERDLAHDVAWHMQPFNCEKSVQLNIFQKVFKCLLSYTS